MHTFERLRHPHPSWRAGALIALAVGALSGADDPGVSKDQILIGECAALSGPASGLGQGMNEGLSAALDHANAQGGVGGRTVKLVSVDDGYDPDSCVSGTLQLLDQDHVFALAGYVGTPTTKVALPILAERHVPLIGAFSGAAVLRLDSGTGKPVPEVFNIRASYDDEAEALVAQLTAGKPQAKVAVFYQNDAFGQAGLAATEKALAKRSLSLCGKGTFERNTVAVKHGLGEIIDASPDAVILVGPYMPVAAFLKGAHEAGFTAALATISFVGTEALIAEAGASAEGLLISQVMPSPNDDAVPLVKEYRAALAASHPQSHVGYASLEGYATGKVLLAALAGAGSPPTRAGLEAACEGMHGLDVGGMSVSFGPRSHQASDRVYLTVVKGGVAMPMQRLDK